LELLLSQAVKKNKKRKTSKPVYKEYNQDGIQLLPPDLRGEIPEGHLVYIVNEVIEGLDIQLLEATYKGSGTSSYHPKMMLKVLVYSYVMRIYSSRKISKALKEDITLMWISGRSKPDFRTINNFRSGRLKGVIEDIFTGTLKFLVDNKYVKLDKYFIDGTKYRADANKHSYVWRKNVERYKTNTIEKIKEVFKEIEAENAREEAEYGEKDLEEYGGESAITSEKVRSYVKEMNEKVKKGLSNKNTERKIKKLENKLLPKIEKYEEQERKLAGRNSYSKTDEDATFMKNKEDEILPEYNVLIGTEEQFIVNYTVSQNASETIAFIDHMEKLGTQQGIKPKAVIGDSTYGSEENYEYLSENDIENYLKYPTYHKEKTRKHKSDKFHRDNLVYDKETDTYKCPNNRKLKFKEIRKKKTRTGYSTEAKIYECESCKYCRLAKSCKKGKHNRTIQVNEKLESYKKEARKNLETEEGIKLRKQRGIDVEPVWGDMKQNQGYVRFRLRSLPKVLIELGILSISHNMKKIYYKLLDKARKNEIKNGFLAPVLST
jgi:transposase